MLCCFLLFVVVRTQTTVVVLTTIPNCFSYVYDVYGRRVCGSCLSGYAPSATRESCVKCMDGCIDCAGSISTCSRCYSGYSLISSTCVKCSLGCQACTSSFYCTQCQSGYFQKIAGSCTSCISGCSVCTNTEECVSCSGGYDLKNENGKNICKMTAGLFIVFVIIFLCICCIIVAVVIRICVGAARTAVQITDGIGMQGRSSFSEMQPKVYIGQPVVHVQPTVYDSQPQYQQPAFPQSQPAYVQPVVYDGNQPGYGTAGANY